jgi:sporulation protein YlmC with PRC-barrel domain
MNRTTTQLAVAAAFTAACATAPVDAAAPPVQPMRASALIGMSAHDRAGHAVGSVKDLVVDPANGSVRYLVVSKGGAMGIAEKLYAVPSARARMDDKRSLRLDVREQDLDASQPVAGHDAKDSAARLRRMSDLLHAKVKDSHGGQIGKVEDMLVDLSAGRVKQVVVKFDRAWNPRDALVTLPMSSFADGATYEFKAPVAISAAPPRNTSPPLALMNPSNEPTKGTASADAPSGGVVTRPPAAAAGPDAPVQALERQPLKTTTSYADDEALVYKGTREELLRAPELRGKGG